MKPDLTRLKEPALVVVFLGLCLENATAADESTTDANIIAAVDISLSVDPVDARIEIEGMAEAIRTPAILRAIKAGHHGRIGFAMIAWYNGVYPVLVPWTLIGSEREAQAVSDRLQNRFPSVIETMAGTVGRRTDISGAIARSTMLLSTAPYVADRLIVNIIGNGQDNVREGPEPARDVLIAMGGTINGVVLGNDPTVVEYYRQRVIGGPGAFLMSANDADTITEVLVRKFLLDIAIKGADDDTRRFSELEDLRSENDRGCRA